MKENVPSDNANEVGVLKRREIEARILVPLLDALGQKFGRDAVLQIARDVIVQIARKQGQQLAQAAGGCTLSHLAQSLGAWKKDGALQIEVLEQAESTFSLNVTGCRYAELYRALGITELGFILSCNRDFALIEGFNPELRLTRTQTIMEGAEFCDFRFTSEKPSPGAKKTTDPCVAPGTEDKPNPRTRS